VQVWIAFLVVSFILGSRAARNGRRDRVSTMLLGCCFVAGLFLFQRFA